MISVVQQDSRATVELLFIAMSPLLNTLDCSLFLQQLKPRNIHNNTGIEPDAGWKSWTSESVQVAESQSHQSNKKTQKHLDSANYSLFSCNKWLNICCHDNCKILCLVPDKPLHRWYRHYRLLFTFALLGKKSYWHAAYKKLLQFSRVWPCFAFKQTHKMSSRKLITMTNEWPPHADQLQCDQASR